jgi:DNA-binding response OmpR family regulator
MADEKSTDPGAHRRLRLDHDEDENLEWAVIRLVLEHHPDAFTEEELLRHLTGGGSSEFSEVDAHKRALRDLAADGLLHPLGQEGFVRPTRAALQYFELSRGAG